MEIKRGDIFFVRTGKNYAIGSEQESGRPAIIVSNDTGNLFAPVVEVVYLTTQEKKPMPTHVDIMCRVPSTALCEQIHTVYKERLDEWVRTCTAEEMKRIDNALMVSLGLEESRETRDAFDFAKIEDENRELKTYLQEAKKVNQCLKKDFAELMEKYEALEKQPIFQPDSEEVVKLKAQVEMLERQNERLLDRLVG